MTEEFQSVTYKNKPVEALPRGELISLIYILCQTIHEQDTQIEALQQANDECREDDMEEIFDMMDTSVRH